MKMRGRIRIPFRPAKDPTPPKIVPSLSKADLAILHELTRTEGKRPTSRVKGRRPNEEELITAAWANVAIEEPTVTRKDAERAITTSALRRREVAV